MLFSSSLHWSSPWNSLFFFFGTNRCHSNWTMLDFYGNVKVIIILTFATMITLWIVLPWLGLLIISRPLVESGSVLHQLEWWVISHWPPENSASSTLCYKFTSGCSTVKVCCHSATDWQVKLRCCLHPEDRAVWRLCVCEQEKDQDSI